LPISKASPGTWKPSAGRATVTRRLCTIAGFYKYAVEEELLEHSPAAHVRRPRVDYESRAVALDRNELGALLVSAGLGPPAEHALISLLALNGLRVSEATTADIELLGLDRGLRTLTITRRAARWSPSRWRRAPPRAMDLAIGERTGGPVFLAAAGRRLDRHGAGRIVRKVGHVDSMTSYQICHGRCEVEAESVAYPVCPRLGMDALDYSLPYVARWAGGDIELVRQTADRVVTVARSIVNDLTPADEAA
jgi:hypothetical protein